MSEKQPLIKKFLIFDTNIIWKSFDAVEHDNKQYAQWLNDVEVFISHKNYNIYISNDIQRELSSIQKIKHLDRLFQEKRTGHPRFNFFTIVEKHTLYGPLQKYFTGNKNDLTGELEAEKADHTLIINAIELAKKYNHDQIPVIVYSNDWEVQNVIKNLGSILPDEFRFTSRAIHWKVGFQLIAEMLLLQDSLGLKSDLNKILKYTIIDYFEWRKRYGTNSDVIELLITTLNEIIHDSALTIKRTKRLEMTLKDLREKYGLQSQTIEEQQSTDQNEQECEEKLSKAIIEGKKGLWSEVEKYLDSPEIKNYFPLLKTYHEIISTKVNKLHTYYKDWNKVFTYKNAYVNLSIQKLLDRDVFKALVDRVVELFKDGDLEEAHTLSIELIPLMTGVLWTNSDDTKYLERFYVIGLYLALYSGNYTEYSEIIDIIQVTIDEKTCQSELIAQHIEFARLVRDSTDNCSINNQFKQQMIQNIKTFYLARKWSLVWNLTLPLWKIISESEKKFLKNIIEDAFAMDLKPPERFENLWNEINMKEHIVKGENMGQPLLDNESEKIVKGTVADFLQGEHLVIDTKTVGRCHSIIHVKSKNSRFGLEIGSSDVDLTNAHTIEFSNESIAQYIKGPKPDEQKYFISGIIKLTKEPHLKIIWKKVDLENITI